MKRTLTAEQLAAPCKRGHTEGRYAGGHCKVCAREAVKRWDALNREHINEQRRARGLACSEVAEKRRETARRWKAENPEKAKTSVLAWQKRNPEKYAACVRKNKRIYTLKIKYGLTVAEYDALVAAQAGLCIICGNPPANGRLSVDHCHTTKTRRGLLCDPCNMGLGLFSENPERLRAAAAYIEKNK